MATFEVTPLREESNPSLRLIERMETLEEVNREGRERLYPTVTNPSWLVLRKRREIFQKWLSELPRENLTVLDVGGRIQPYRPLLQDRLRKYVAVDVRRSPLVSAVARAEQIPLAGLQFDLVICTQVLEYVAEPATVVTEIYRVLKPGGSLLLSVPAIFPRDSDFDTWRFMPRSLRILLRSFREVEIVPEGDSIAGLFRTMCVGTVTLAKPAPFRKLLRFTLIPVVNVLGFCFESIVSGSNDQFTANFSVLAKK